MNWIQVKLTVGSEILINFTHVCVKLGSLYQELISFAIHVLFAIP